MKKIDHHLDKMKEGFKNLVTQDTSGMEFTVSILMVLAWVVATLTNAPIEKEINHPKLTVHLIGAVGIFLFMGVLTNTYRPRVTYGIRNLTTIVSLLLNVVILFDLGESRNSGTNVYWEVLLIPNLFCFISTFAKYNYYKNEFRHHRINIWITNFFAWSVRSEESMGFSNRKN